MSRILLLIPEITGIGGAERMVAALAGLLGEQHEVHVAAFEEAGARPGFALTVPFHPLGEERRRALPLRWRTYLHQARALAALERRLGIKVTISNLWRADLISALAGGATCRVALAHTNVLDNPNNRTMLRLRPLVAALYRRFDALVAVSNDLTQELAALYRLPPGRAVAIENFVTPFEGAPVTASGRTRIAWCGRMVAGKNVPALLDAFAAVHRDVPAAQLLLIGDGPDRVAVEARIAANDLTHATDPADAAAAVVWTGTVADPAPLIAGAALLALPSRAEGLPMVLLEALAVGVPAICADCPSGGVHAALGARTPHDPARAAPERTDLGVLMPVPDTPARIVQWAGALGDLLVDPAALSKLARGARSAAAQFGPDAARARWRALLAGLPIR